MQKVKPDIIQGETGTSYESRPADKYPFEDPGFFADYPSQPTEQEGRDVGLFRYLEILLLHKWLMVGILTASLLISFILFNRAPKFYVSTFSVYYNKSVKELIVDSNVPYVQSDFDKNYWINVMRSEQLMQIVRECSSLPYSANQLNSMLFAEMQDRKVDNIFNVTVSSKIAGEIPSLSKAFVDGLNKLDQLNQIRSSEKLINYFNKQITDNNEKLNEIDNQVGKIGSQFNLEKFTDVSQISKVIQDFQSKLMDAQVEIASVKAMKDKIEEELKNMDGTIVNETAFSEPLKVQLMNLQVDLARALTKYKEDHPAIISIRENINQIYSLLKDGMEQNLEMKSLVPNPVKTELLTKLVNHKINYIALETRISSLNKVISELNKQMAPTSEGEGIQVLIRKRDILLGIINMVNGKLIEAQSTYQGKLSKFSMIDVPSPPAKPSTKKLRYFLFIGFAVGLMLSILAVYLYDLLDNRVRLVSDFQKFFNIPILGTVSHSKNQDFLDNKKDNDDKDRETRLAYNEIAEIYVNLKQKLKEKNKKVISICSAIRKEGKTTFSLQLAMEFAKKGTKVLLVDADVFLPRITQMVTENQPVGLQNYLLEENSLDEVIQTTSTNNLWVVGAGNNTNGVTVQYENHKFQEFVDQVRDKFDLILFDTPAMLYIPDIVHLIEKMDATVLMVRIMYSSRKAFEKVLSRIALIRGTVLGTIITDVRHSPLSKYSGYYYYYGYYYSYYDDPERKVRKKKRKRK